MRTLVRGKKNKAKFARDRTLALAVIPASTKMFDFGPSHGDEVMEMTDDGCIEVPLARTIYYFGVPYNRIYISNNGWVAFDGCERWYTPMPMYSSQQQRKMIAPLWCDIDTRFGIGFVYYHQYTGGTMLKKGQDYVENALQGISNFHAREVMVITWYDTTFYGANASGKLKRNSFQLVLVASNTDAYAFGIYDRVDWTAGTASGGDASTGLVNEASKHESAGVAFSNGVNTGQFYEVPHYSRNYNNATFMPQVTNIQGPYVANWPGNWLFQLNLVGQELGPIMECLRDYRCCVMQGNVYTGLPRYSCTKFTQMDYLNAKVEYVMPCAGGTAFNIFPTTCACDHLANVDAQTCRPINP